MNYGEMIEMCFCFFVIKPFDHLIVQFVLLVFSG